MPRYAEMKRLIVPVIGLALLLALPLEAQRKSKKRTKAPPKAAAVSFKKNVVPVFRTYCLPCHTEDQMNPSELYMDSYENLMKGGKHGSPVIPLHADSSLLIMKLGPKPPFGDPMPLKRKTPIPQDTIDILKKWIGQGGKNN